MYSDNQEIQFVVSYNELKDIIENEIYIPLNQAMFNTKDKSLNPSKPICGECMENTGFNTDLFNDITDQSYCTNSTCFKKKLKKHIFNRKDELITQKIKVTFLREEVHPYGQAEKQIDIYHTMPSGSYILHKSKDLNSGDNVGIFISVNTNSKFVMGQEVKLESPAAKEVKSTESKSVVSKEEKTSPTKVVEQETPIQIRERKLLTRHQNEKDLDKMEVRKLLCQKISEQKTLKPNVIKEVAEKLLFSFSTNNLMVLKLYKINPISFENKETANLQSVTEVGSNLMQVFLNKFKTEKDLKTLILRLVACFNLDLANRHNVNIQSVNSKSDTGTKLIQIAQEYNIKPLNIYKPIALKREKEHKNELLDLEAAKLKAKSPKTVPEKGKDQKN